MWVPVGGYLASLALRAAHAESAMARPASLTVHYLGEAEFAPVDLEVTRLKTSPEAESLQVRMTQNGEPVLMALIWATPTGVYGPKANFLPPAEVPPPDDLPDIVLDEDVIAMMGDEPMWKNFEIRPVRLGHTIDVDTAGKTEEELRLLPKRHPRIRAWDRFMNGQTFADPWLEACRYLIITDVSQFPTMATPFTPPLPFVAPTLDLTVEFHNFVRDEWLLIEGNGSYAGDGLLGCESRLWDRSGELLATGYSHMTFKDLSAPSSPAEEHAWFETVGR